MSKVRMAALALGFVLGLGVALGTSGCVRHVHRDGPDTVVILDREHDDPAIVVVIERPAAERHCWKHRKHWHCRRY